MKRYLQKVDSDYNAFLAKMNASGSHPLTLAKGGGNDIFYGNGSGLRKAKFRSTADNSLGVSTLAPFSVFKVDGGENLAFETETTEMTIKMGADTVQDIDGMLTTTASVPYAMNIFQIKAKSQVEILPDDMILGLDYADAAVALSPMMTVGEYVDQWSSDVMYTENDAFILDLTSLYVDCVNMMGNLTFIAYLARQNEDGSMQIIDIDLTYKCQLGGEHIEINVGPNDVSLNADGTATFNMDIFSFPIGDYVIECDSEIPDDYYLVIAGYNTANTDSPNILNLITIQNVMDDGCLLNRNKIFLNSAIIEMLMANFNIDRIAFFIVNEDGSIILSTKCSFYSINQELLAPYYFETEGEHEVEFEYTYKFMPELSFPRTNSYFSNSCIIELNDNFYDYYNPGNIISNIEKINLSNNVPENIAAAYISSLKSYSNLKEININTDKYITINNCVINKTNWSLAGYCGTDVVVPGLVKSIGTKFSGDSNLKTVVLPNGITSIPLSAFRHCSSLTSINIPDSVTSIGSNAFVNCSSLTLVTIPDSVTSIGSDAFYGCSNLTSVTVGNGVTSIGSNAFVNCSNLTSVNISSLESWLNINFSSFNSNPLVYAKNLYLNGQLITDLVIPNSVTSIGQYAFYVCSSLTSVNIPDSVTSIGREAFYSCSNLTSVTVGNGVTSIGSSVFYNCKLSEITCYAMTAPTIKSSTFQSIKTGGVLKVPTGATGYDTQWMKTTSYYLGYYNWSIQNI